MLQAMEPNKFVGSKAAPGTYHRIINQIPPHRIFIEPFAGRATIARLMRPSAETILIDKAPRPELATLVRARQACHVIAGDGARFLAQYRFRGDEFVYADPPYLLRTRQGREYYPHEMTDADHERLLRVLLGLNVRVALSGYRSALYDERLATWRRIEWQAMTRGGTKATEVLWLNYPPPTTLHDYRYVGDHWRDRERLRRKTARAVADLMSMPVLERAALFSAMVDAMRSPAAALSETGERIREGNALLEANGFRQVPPSESASVPA